MVNSSSFGQSDLSAKSMGAELACCRMGVDIMFRSKAKARFVRAQDSGSAAQYLFLGSSANLNLQQEVAGNSSYVDVEFIDPMIMAVSRGKLPLPMTHQISPNYSSNMLADFSEMDQRLQLLQSRSSNLN